MPLPLLLHPILIHLSSCPHEPHFPLPLPPQVPTNVSHHLAPDPHPASCHTLPAITIIYSSPPSLPHLFPYHPAPLTYHHCFITPTVTMVCSVFTPQHVSSSDASSMRPCLPSGDNTMHVILPVNFTSLLLSFHEVVLYHIPSMQPCLKVQCKSISNTNIHYPICSPPPNPHKCWSS